MMYEKQRRPLCLFAQHAVQPGLAPLAKSSFPLPRRRRVDRYQAHRVVLDRVVQEVAIAGQLRMIAEGSPQGFLVIAIAGHEVERRVERRKQLAQQYIFLWRAVLDGVPRKDHRIGTLLPDIRHATPQAVSPQTRCGPIRRLCQDVGIADLGD